MKMLDLFCGAGGTSYGYSQAGFTVTGIDIAPQPHYPYDFIQADAMTYPLSGYDVIVASPPCQHYSKSVTIKNRGNFDDLIAPTRIRLLESKLPYVIENVIGAPLINPVMLCGSMFGLGVWRHRIFESNIPLHAPLCDHTRCVLPITVVGHCVKVVVYGDSIELGVDAAREAMGIFWMTQKELSQSVPPAYTKYIGRQLVDYMKKHKGY